MAYHRHVNPLSKLVQLKPLFVCCIEGQSQQEAPLYDFSLAFFYHSNDYFVINLIDDYAGFIFSVIITCFCVKCVINIYNFSKWCLTIISLINHLELIKCKPMPSLQHVRGWSHEATKNILNANNMTDIVNVFRCTYVTYTY